MEPERLMLACRSFLDHQLASRVLELRRELERNLIETNSLRDDLFMLNYIHNTKTDPLNQACRRQLSRGGNEELFSAFKRHGLSYVYVEREVYDFQTGKFVVDGDPDLIVKSIDSERPYVNIGDRISESSGWTVEKAAIIAFVTESNCISHSL